MKPIIWRVIYAFVALVLFFWLFPPVVAALGVPLGSFAPLVHPLALAAAVAYIVWG